MSYYDRQHQKLRSRMEAFLSNRLVTPFLIGLTLALGWPSASMPEAAWTKFADAQSGMTITYPAHLFPRTVPTEEGFRFSGADAEFEISARDDVDLRSVRELRTFIANSAGYSSLTYGPVGKGWMVASGYRDGVIYYEKFFLRGGHLRAFSIQYPTHLRPTYDRIVERLENEFRPW